MANSFFPANILLPKDVDMKKWSVVACDQFTSEPEYWNEVENNVGDAFSTLRLIFPEIYLSEGEERIKKINSAMKDYIEKGIFKEYKNTFIYLKRKMQNGKIRRGLIGQIDLEEYSFVKGVQSNVRATEGTVLERIPPRVKIRENAELEFPHVMVLIDDVEKKVIESLDSEIDNFDLAYDFELMQGGGHVTGYVLDKNGVDGVMNALSELSSDEAFVTRYGIKDVKALTFAVGDGNHSLATAKTCWENIKNSLTEEEKKNHPARYALVELVNLHDESLEFEPIHRVVFGVNPDKMYNEMLKFYPDYSEKDNGDKHIICKWKGVEKQIWIKDDNNNLAVGTLQDFIDAYIKENGGEVDYIHGDKVVDELSSKENNIGFLLPAMEKSELFTTVILDGALPRKTFSMGEAYEKRYYLEGKKIVK